MKEEEEVPVTSVGLEAFILFHFLILFYFFFGLNWSVTVAGFNERCNLQLSPKR